MSPRAALGLALVATLICGAAQAATFHVAASAAQGGDGSPARPFASIRAAFLSGRLQDGDRLSLAPGFYGAPTIRAAGPRDAKTKASGRIIRDVVIEGEGDPRAAAALPDPGRGAAWLGKVVIHQAEGLTLSNLLVMPRPRPPEPAPAPIARADDGTPLPLPRPARAKRRGPLVLAHRTARRVALEQLEMRSAPDAEIARWTRGVDWRRNARDGIRLDGPDGAARGNRLTGVNFGIQATGPRAVVENNEIDLFGADGIRVLGDGSRVHGNLVHNCVATGSGNHDDGIQSWSVGKNRRAGSGVVRDVTLSANRIFEWDRPGSARLACSLQGIGLFDGVYENLTIENNLIVVDQYHGITVMGGKNVRVVNNTVLNRRPGPQARPWIMFRAHKNGARFGGNVAANNMAMKFSLPDWTLSRRNLRIRYPGLVIRDRSAGDYRPRPDGPAHRAADPAFQPPRDLNGAPRPASGGDLGALESGD
ncbi:right-handed parallel beta-helix repeat-containing protein [Oceanicella actignis]|uniref:Right handed beta helix region n=1 Tax=Oceanicella actignis TaxID=1189325 RepID=A0A1M7T4S1_9RHOB|nr:right-handed parallel beta-helix repeat-containing protein [Oceanicella actignis]SET42256.1 Right handed beta helix region [Oceanicella actignis]SHN65729.1 Right handed beta helix region [Oceanicella actignis]